MQQPFNSLSFIITASLILLVMIGLGVLLDNMLLAMTIVLASLLLFHYLQIYRLNRWIWHSKQLSPPDVFGLWRTIYEGIYQMQRRSRAKRKELGELVKRFRQGAEALPDAVIIFDDHAKIVWCNRLARIELGIRWPEDVGVRIDNLIRHPDFIEYFQQADFMQPIEVPSHINRNKVNEYRIMPYGDDNYLLLSRDVSRVSKLEEMRRDFVANVSHEMRTPLTVMSGYLEMINLQQQDDPLLQKALPEMELQSHRMQNLIEDLLVLSRIESSNERIFEQVVDVPQVLRMIQSEAERLNHDKQHQICFHIDPELHIYGVETELRSAFSNLVFNAINYTPEQGEIDVYWQHEDQQAKFTVKDNGDGIEEQHLLRLTERFYRVDKARSRKTGGSGLGLSIVKHVLNHHNSQLEISSTVGVGSQFYFVFNEEMVAKHG